MKKQKSSFEKHPFSALPPNHAANFLRASALTMAAASFAGPRG
jgi:hypothetical protein